MKYAQIVMGTAGTGKVRCRPDPAERTCFGTGKPNPTVHRAAFPPAPSLLQSTYCKAFQEHCAAAGRSVRVANLDPAAENFGYQVRRPLCVLVGGCRLPVPAAGALTRPPPLLPSPLPLPHHR
jgi:hypothetical protein